MKRALTRWKKNEAAYAIRRSRLVLKTPNIDVKIAPKTTLHARILVVTPRKSGNAVQRNLFRRRFRALFYEQKLNKGDVNWIVFAKPGISTLSFYDTQQLFLQVLRTLSDSSSTTAL